MLRMLDTMSSSTEWNAEDHKLVEALTAVQAKTTVTAT